MMEAALLQTPWFLYPLRAERSSVHFSCFPGDQHLCRVPVSCKIITRDRRYGPHLLQVSRSSGNAPGSVLKPDCPLTALSDESEGMKMQLLHKADEVEQYLNGRCLYLVGMMGSGKTTVGKVLSDIIGYSFCDCDTLIEEAVGKSSVAEIFKLYGEGFFRDNETKVLQKLSSMRRLVVSTGGGVVIRPINWTHMRKGISVWLDVPLEALAQRITAVGTDSRPLLHQDSGDDYSKTMKRLSALFEERGGAYANADVKVSLEYIAANLGLEDVSDLTLSDIALEVLLQLENFLKK